MRLNPAYSPKNLRDSLRGAFPAFGLLLAVATAGVLAAPASAVAQGGRAKKGPETEKITGKVAEIEKKGKAVTLTIDKEDGNKLEVLVTPKLKLEITGKGDTSFFQPKTWVSSESIIKTNNELFGRQFTVHLGVAPPPHVKADTTATDVYHVAGQVMASTEDSLTMNFGAAGTKKVTFEEGASVEVTINANDPDLIVEGSEVEVEGVTRGTKFLPSRVAVTLEKPLTPEDIQAADKDKKGAKGKTAAKGGKKPAKGKTEDSDEEGAADPLGVLGKKEGKDGKGGKTPEKDSPDKEKE